MQSPIHAKINERAAVHNCMTLRKHAKSRKLFPVVKADAYGHGLTNIVNAVKKVVDGFCVFQYTDALIIREQKIDLPIFVLGGFRNKEELSAITSCNAWALIHQPEQLSILTQAQQLPPRVFIKAQTGMHRLGIDPQVVVSIVDQVKQLGVDTALMHHFADSDVEGGTNKQAKVMQDLVQTCQLPFTASNSAATLLDSNADMSEEFVRCGIAVYGCSPATDTHSAKDLGLKPVMHLESEVISIQKLKKGQTVGYGSRWRAKKDTNIAVVACGYADGYPRVAPDNTLVAIGDKSFPIAGRVSMEMLTVDIGSHPIKLGSTVQLWGDVISCDDVASQANTISYELLAGMPIKVPRVIKDSYIELDK